jgi:AcrR family transcriptional regulator
VSLDAIALAAGLTKPNLYRYFESWEDILLVLFLEELRSFTREVVAGLSGASCLGSGSEQDVASLLVEAYARRPRLCRFLGAIASVLEHNVSARIIEDMKRTSLALGFEVASALHGALPGLTVERCLWLNNMTALLVAGLWPPAHPAPAVNEVLTKPEFSGL